MKNLRLLVLLLPYAAACGGQVFLDNAGKGSDGSDAGVTKPPTSDAGADARTVSSTCTATPEVVATVTGDIAHVDSLFVTPTRVFYTVSNMDANDPKDPLKRGLHAVQLDTKVDTVLVPADPRAGAIGTTLAAFGDDVYFTAPLVLPNDALGPSRVYKMPARGGSIVEAFTPDPSREYSDLTVSPTGALFGQSTPVTTNPMSTGWRWTAGETSETPFDFTVSLKKHRAFDGGFVAVSMDGSQVFLGLESLKRGVLVHAPPDGRKVLAARPLRRTAFILLYAMQSPAAAAMHADRIVRDACVTGLDGARSCVELNQIPYSAAPNVELVDFDVRSDDSLVVSQTDNSGLRPTAQVVWVRDGNAQVIGGEGVNGTVTEITALQTVGSCTYWAERRPNGGAIMRVAR